MNIAKSNQLAKYINDRIVPPPEIDKFDTSANKEVLKLWLDYQAGNMNIQLVITINCKAIPV